MKLTTLLLRQVHPSFVDRGRITSQVFKPTTKDNDKLSVDDGDNTTAEAAFRNYTECRNRQSVGVVAVTLDECDKLKLPVNPDPLKCDPSHTVIDFSGLSRNKQEAKAKILKNYADVRGWQYRRQMDPN